MDKLLEHWTVLVFCLCFIVPGVNGDDARDALIASACVVGVLILFSALICVFCYYRIKRKAEEKTQPIPYANGTLSKGMYNRQLALEHKSIRGPPAHLSMRGPPPVRHISATAQRAKAYTQHAAGPKQRPPVIFYTIKNDPRMPRNSPDAIPIGPPHPYRAAPVGRPVIFLDWINPRKPNANGGPIIQEIDTVGSKASKRYHSPDKARARSKSRSRSRDPHQRSRSRPRGDQRDTTVRHADGDVIFASQSEDIKRYSRNASIRSQRRSDSNNNLSNGSVGQFSADGGRYSVTQVPSNEPVIPTSLHQDRELTLNFGDDLESIPEPTPRVDYSRDYGTAGVIKEEGLLRNASVNHGFVPDSVEPTPRPDYSARDAPNSPISAGSIDDIIALGSTSDATDVKQAVRDRVFQQSHRQNPNHARPPTPPSDGMNRRGPDNRQEVDAERRLRQLVQTAQPPPPPAPPLPSPQTDYPDVHKANWRSPTPPPGRIRHNPDVDLDEILRMGDRSSSKPTVQSGARSATSQAIKEGGLPFLVELMKRRPTVDAGTPPVSADRNQDFDPTYQRIITNDATYQRIITNDDKDGTDFHRPSTVQFAQSPPQVIPRGSENMNNPDYTLPSYLKGQAPPPPGPPPPPPVQTQLSSDNMVLY